MSTKVVFRKFRDHKDIIALFPHEPADVMGYYCMSYQHIGQHGAADPHLGSVTTLATPAEYKPLLKELHKIGYRNLVIGQKVTAQDDRIRMKEADDYRKRR